MEPRLVQQQSQKLILSPQIRQYLRLLQMPVTELAQAVEQEMTENPLLEEKPAEIEEEYAPEPQDADRVRDDQELQMGDRFERLQELESDSDPPPVPRDYGQASAGDLQDQKNYRDSLLTKPEALSDYLLWQIRFFDLSEDELKVAEEIIGNIDEKGYLQATLEEIAAGSGASVETVHAVLKKIQSLEPPGIAARTLQEALLLQLERQYPGEALAYEIVRDHLPLLEKRDWQQLARILARGLDEIKRAADIIIRLEPRPGRSFYAEEPIAVTPDAAVWIDENSGQRLRIEILNEKIPELRINNYYRHMLRDKNLDETARQFLKNKLQGAMDFLKAIKQRKSTLREITEELVKEQPEFFEKGFSHLKPLRLKDIANNLGIHESTVSRAIHGKYMQTPQGTIAYRSFFSSKLDTTSGEAESQKSIMAKIKKLIAEENPAKPLSDQDLGERLKSEGIIIARRTVAKYRELLKILPSHLRRKR